MLLELIIIVASAKLAGALAVRLKQPSVLGEMLAGLVLGPSVLNLLHPSATINELAEIGVIMLMFLAGLETDLKQMVRAGKTSLVTAVGGVAIPMVAGYFVSLQFGYNGSEALFIGTILTATSVSISAQTLMDLGQLRSREGVAILGAALIDDVIGIVVVTLVVSLSSGVGGIGLLLAKILLYFVVALLVGAPAIRYLAELARHFRASEGLAAFALVICFSMAWAAEAAGVAAITGAFIAGLLFKQTDDAERVAEKASTIAYSFFTPIFFLSIGIESQLNQLGGLWGFAIVVAVVSIITKVLGCGGAACLTGMNARQGLRVGIGMISRGEVALITASIGLKSGLLSPSTYSVIVLMVLTTTIATPPFLKLSFGTARSQTEAFNVSH